MHTTPHNTQIEEADGIAEEGARPGLQRSQAGPFQQPLLRTGTQCRLYSPSLKPCGCADVVSLVVAVAVVVEMVGVAMQTEVFVILMVICGVGTC